MTDDGHNPQCPINEWENDVYDLPGNDSIVSSTMAVQDSPRLPIEILGIIASFCLDHDILVLIQHAATTHILLTKSLDKLTYHSKSKDFRGALEAFSAYKQLRIQMQDQIAKNITVFVDYGYDVEWCLDIRCSWRNKITKIECGKLSVRRLPLSRFPNLQIIILDHIHMFSSKDKALQLMWQDASNSQVVYWTQQWIKNRQRRRRPCYSYCNHKKLDANGAVTDEYLQVFLRFWVTEREKGQKEGIHEWHVTELLKEMLIDIRHLKVVIGSKRMCTFKVVDRTVIGWNPVGLELPRRGWLKMDDDNTAAKESFQNSPAAKWVGEGDTEDIPWDSIIDAGTRFWPDEVP